MLTPGCRSLSRESRRVAVDHPRSYIFSGGEISSCCRAAAGSSTTGTWDLCTSAYPLMMRYRRWSAAVTAAQRRPGPGASAASAAGRTGSYVSALGVLEKEWNGLRREARGPLRLPPVYKSMGRPRPRSCRACLQTGITKKNRKSEKKRGTQ